jgi:hypothetical protein
LVSQPSALTPLQSPKPALQARPHALFEQVAVEFGTIWQTWPHNPQLLTSACVFVQVPLHEVCPDGQEPQIPAWQTDPPEQDPQLRPPPHPSGIVPQFLPWAEQVVGVHPQIFAEPPPPHVWEPVQDPQFRVPPQPSEIEPHCAPLAAQVVGVHDAAQTPLTHEFDLQSVFTRQAWPLAHAAQVVPPQSTLVSVPFFTPSLQLGAGVTQVPFWQLWPLAHALPHAPQLLAELVTLVSQPVLTLWSQSLKPAAQA